MRTSPLTRILAVVGAVAILAAAVGGALAASMLRRGFSARDEPSAVEAALARRMRSLAAGGELRRLRNPVGSSPEVLAEGREHWAGECALCHGNDGRGQTEIGRNLYPRAPDMRQPATQQRSDGELYAIIENGIRLTGMPAWGTGAPDSKESWALVSFIRHLPEQTEAELEEMEKLNPRPAGEAEEAEPHHHHH